MEAEAIPLRELLLHFHEAGVRVKMDPALAAERISGSVTNEPLEKALEKLVIGLDFAVFWTRISGPAGAVDRAIEIQLFPRGKPERAQPLFWNSNLDVAEAGAVRFVRGEVLMGFRSGTTQEQVSRLLGRIGGEVVGGIPGLGAYLIRVPPNTNIFELLEQLRREEQISFVEPNYVYALPIVGRNSAGGPPASDHEAGTGGGSALLAIFDSGVREQTGLKSWIAGSYNSLHSEETAEDTLGHGTQMAWIAAGLISPEGGRTPEIISRNVLSIKGFDDNGVTSSWAVLEAIRIATEHNAKVINISWGSETASVFLQEAFRRASERGLLIVAAAGNEPTGRAMYPAAWPGVLAIGATDPNGSPSAYSNHGSFVDMSAPALATLPVGYAGPPGSYAGTSIASAFTAGVIAQYLGENPGVSSQAALLRMRSVLTPFNNSSGSSLNGGGILDAAAVRRFLAK